MENKPLLSPILFYKHFCVNCKISSLCLIYRTKPELYNSWFIVMCKEYSCSQKRMHFQWWSLPVQPNLSLGIEWSPSYGEGIGFLLLVGDALNIGQNLLSRRQMLLLRIRRSFTWNCLESEFGSSPFSIIHWSFVNPKTDRLQRIHLSVSQGGKKVHWYQQRWNFL